MNKSVGKHRAPKGALRLLVAVNALLFSFASRKAPSAKRCIKTSVCLFHRRAPFKGQKAPSAKRCIKTTIMMNAVPIFMSQKAPSAKRCIKTLMDSHTPEIVEAMLEST